MRKHLYLLAAALAAFAPPGVLAHGPHHAKPACEPGYTIVEEVCYKEVVTKVCKVVPDVKKTVKWVYDCKPEDFCLPKCSCPLHGLKKHHGCETCAS